ncbi:hypothetical protein C0991_009831 [Blastosporella zonata]|nr:hypothetical protein C0991_009831 [Blastosporella zonata]
MQHTPGGFGMLNFDPWNAPPPAWAQATGQPPAVPQPRNDLPEYLHKRSDANVADRVDPFMAGPGYGTSLEPFEVALLGLRPRVNPLLEPLPADINSDRPHLKWNMLFKSNDCSRSTDDPYVSWSKGRDEPATFPRVTKMSIISETVPWTVEVKASNEAIGVTCGEVIEALAENFYLLSTGPEYERLDLKGKNAVFAAYNRNRSRDPGFAVTAQEARDNEARQKAHEEKERADALREEQRRKEESDRLRQSMDQTKESTRFEADDPTSLSIPSWNRRSAHRASIRKWSGPTVAQEQQSPAHLGEFASPMVYIPRSTVDLTAMKRHDPQQMWPHGVNVALVGGKKQMGQV